MTHIVDSASHAPEADAATSRLGVRLRAERERQGWTLDELARRSDVSRAMLSRIERGTSSPTATVLGRISAAFSLSVSDLLAALQPATPRLVRDSAAERWQDPATGYERRAITRREFPVDVTEVVLPPGEAVTYPAAAFSFLKHTVWVLGGELEIQEGPHSSVLQPGDVLEFGEPAAVEYRNTRAVPCRYLVIAVRA